MSFIKAIEAKECDWLQISQEDVKKIGMKVENIFIALEENKIRIIWQCKGKVWESYRECKSSFKKTIIQTIYNPTFRGELNFLKAQETIQGSIIHCNLDDIDLYQKIEVEEATEGTEEGDARQDVL